MEACLDLLVSEMINVVERKFGNKEKNLIDLTKLFSQFEKPFLDLKTTNLETAYQAWSRWMSSIIGPSLRPYGDKSGSLNIVSSFMKGQWLLEDDRSIKMIQRSASYKIAMSGYQSHQERSQIAADIDNQHSCNFSSQSPDQTSGLF